MRRPPRLQKRGHRFYCRASVPRDLRPILEKSEIVRPLKTAEYGEALQRLPLVSAAVNAELAAARRKLSAAPATSLSDHDARQMVLRWLWRDERRAADAERATDGEQSLCREEAISELCQDLSQMMDPDDPVTGGYVRKIAQGLLDEYNLQLEEGSPARSKLCELVRRAMIERVRRDIDRLKGDFGRAHDALFRGVEPANPEPALPARTSVTLNNLLERFLADPTRSAGPKADSDYRVVLRLMGEFISLDTPLSRVTRDHCREVAGLLKSLPANTSKKRGFSEMKPLQAAAEAKRLGVPAMSASTANSYITKLSALFRWAVREGLIERNPAEGLMLPEGTHKRDARLPFSIDQLNAILSSAIFREPRERWDHRQWVFVVALFSGLRLNEACTLTCDDLEKRDGVDVILVRPDEEGRKRLKSRAARRMVPVHPTLKKLGFLAYLERQRADGHEVLFPGLKPDRRGYYSDGYQKWFARLLKKAGAAAPRTSFHSTRHNFRDQLREMGAPRDITLALGGWAGDGTADHYGGGLQPRTLLRWVRKIAYAGLVLPPAEEGESP